MQRKTTTKQIQNAIKSNLLILKSAGLHNKDSQVTETIPNDKFLECFDFFCESGFFMDAVGWHFERNHATGNYIIEAGRMNGDSDAIIEANFHVNDSINKEKIERMLLFEEE